MNAVALLQHSYLANIARFSGCCGTSPISGEKRKATDWPALWETQINARGRMTFYTNRIWREQNATPSAHSKETNRTPQNNHQHLDLTKGLAYHAPGASTPIEFVITFPKSERETAFQICINGLLNYGIFLIRNFGIVVLHVDA